MSKDLYLKYEYNGHNNLQIPVKILHYPPEPNGDYVVYSIITDKTFSINEREVKLTPPDSEYVVSNTVNVKSYYKGKSSLYKFAEEWNLNSWEFDIVKRIIRCRHKGHFIEDLEKTKAVIDIYLQEHKNA